MVHSHLRLGGLLAPSAPKDFSFDIDKNSAGYVLADPDDVFRILFNLMGNAVSVANREESAMKSVTIRVTTEGKVVTAHVSDDGPGLPACIQSRCSELRSCHRARARGAKRGHTHACPAAKGVNFELKLAAFVSVFPRNGPRYFARRAVAL